MKKIILALCLILVFCFDLYAVDVVQPKSQNTAAEDFTLQDLSGNNISLSDFYGKPVILFFWTTWCPHCRRALSNFNNEYDNLKNIGIELLAIDVGESESRVESFINKNSITYPVLLDHSGDVSKEYDVLGVPTVILINKEGGIVSVSNGLPADYKSLLFE